MTVENESELSVMKHEIECFKKKLLLFGNSCDEFGFSLPVKAIAQIIL